MISYGSTDMYAVVSNENTFAQYHVSVDFESPQRWRVNDITTSYTISLQE